MASSLTFGMLVQYATTCLVCLALALSRSWSLTLVILSAVPLLMAIQAFSQAFAGPLLAAERAQIATAGTLVDRAVVAIATVKAFNAVPHELSALNPILDSIRGAARKLNAAWGFTSCLSQFVMMTMFVQGFWFGAKLVRDGKISAGDVMSVFWACLIATSNMQMCIPQLITLTKGKFAAVSLLGLIDGTHLASPSPTITNQSSVTILSPHKHRRPMYLRKIVPPRCTGEFTLHNVTFAYPSRPTVPVLTHVSIYLPANETTFIVGGSGSGKSTLAQLLLRMYNPQDGTIQLDDQDVAYLDEAWMRQHVAGISQNCILFDMSVHDNVALGLANSVTGRRPEDATRKEVIEACRMALLHDFVRDLPDGYDTKLGNGGANLSGVQKQRLAIARARLRNPTVLILGMSLPSPTSLPSFPNNTLPADEATSALDATSRILVFEAIKRWRRNQTTIVITHDLSQIGPNDFVYVLKGGSVVEQGYRYDLEMAKDGEFRDMMEMQGATGGYLPEKEEQAQIVEVDAILEKATQLEKEDVESLSEEVRPFNLKHQSLARPSLRPVTLGNWMFEAVAELTKDAPTSAVLATRQASMVHRFVPPEAFARSMTPGVRPRRPSSVHIPSMPETPTAAYTPTSRSRFSLQFSPTSPIFSSRGMDSRTSLATTTVGLVEDEEGFDVEKAALRRVGSASRNRPRRARAYGGGGEAVITVCKANEKDRKSEKSPEQLQPFWSLMLDIFPTVPHKPLVALGVMICIMSGAMTPIFSFLLSRLMFEVSVGASNSSAVNIIGGIVLSVAALDGILVGLKFFVMQTAAMSWVTRIRKLCYELVLAQDKRWFDKSENSALRVVQVLVKDGDDARNLIAIVLGQFFVVSTMLSVGLVWALVRGWQLTLVGFAIAPIFGITMALQANLVAKCEVRNKRAREEVAKGYYEVVFTLYFPSL
jgi:ATP-binding cassette subfamily B (MDR/TAP) protein 1